MYLLLPSEVNTLDMKAGLVINFNLINSHRLIVNRLALIVTFVKFKLK